MGFRRSISTGAKIKTGIIVFLQQIFTLLPHRLRFLTAVVGTMGGKMLIMHAANTPLMYEIVVEATWGPLRAQTCNKVIAVIFFMSGGRWMNFTLR